LIGETLNPTSLIMVHLLSIPYLLVCAGIGLVFSTIFDRGDGAPITAMGLVFVLWLVDGVTKMDPDFEWIGDLTLTRYYDTNEILVHGEYAFIDAGILLLAFLVLLLVSAFIFVTRDI